MQIQAAQRITATDAMLRDIYSDGNEEAPVKKLIHDQASEAGDGDDQEGAIWIAARGTRA
jgi:hypothetical protein